MQDSEEFFKKYTTWKKMFKSFLKKKIKKLIFKYLGHFSKSYVVHIASPVIQGLDATEGM